MRVATGSAAPVVATIQAVLGVCGWSSCLIFHPFSTLVAGLSVRKQDTATSWKASWPWTKIPRGRRLLGCPPPRYSRSAVQCLPNRDADGFDDSVVRCRSIKHGDNLDERNNHVLRVDEDHRNLESVSVNSGPDPSASGWGLQSISTKLTDRQRGLLVLMTVPVAWGTYEPAVRYVYAHAQPPIPPFAFSLAYYAVAAATLVLLAAIEKPASSSLLESKEAARKVGSSSDLANLPSADRLIEQVSPLEVQPAPPTLATDGSKRGAMVTVAGGIELGSYLFVGNAMQLLGLQTVSSDRAAFLLQLTTVFVPLLQAVVARNVEAVSLHVWCACVVALAGVFVMGLDGGGIDPSLLGVTTFGEGLVDLTRAFSTSLEVTATSDDLLVVGAAVAYTLHCVRLEKYAKQAPSAVQLAAAKASTEALLTLATVLVFVSYYFASLGDSSSQAASAAAVAPAGDNILLKFALDSGRGLVDYASALRNGLGSSLEPTEAPNALASLWPVAAATLWSGWVTIAYTIYAQSYGQRRVRPATANLIYTVQPICTAIVAWMVLGETMGPAGYAGGTLIGAAVLLVVAAPTA